MNEEIKNKLWALTNDSMKALEYHDKDDEHWETMLALVCYTARELLILMNEEE